MTRAAALLAAVGALGLAQVAGAAPLAGPQAAAAATAGTASPALDYRERHLANGLHVFTLRDTTTPNVSVQVWYGVGSKNDPAGRSGFAHLFEHMMFKATRDMPAENLDRLTEDVGGQNNASTWDDFTNYYEVVPANHLERLLWAEAQRMSSLKVDQANFASERDVVKEELRQSYLANPYGRMYLAVADASYTLHPYKRSGIGSLGDLDHALLPDVVAFHDTFYRPDDANLLVVGNFDPAELDRWIDRYFGAIARPAAPIPTVTAVEPPRTGPKRVTAYGPIVPLPAVAITWPIPDAASPDMPALRVLAAVLSTGKSSRLYDSLVYRQQISQRVDADAGRNAQPGVFELQSVMAQGRTPDQGEAALLAEVARLQGAPVSAAELDRAKNQLVAETLRGRESLIGRGFQLGQAILLEGDPARVNSEVAGLRAVGAADVRRAAVRYLPADRRVTVRYLPESARPAGEAPGADLAQVSPRVQADVVPAGVAAPPPPESLPHLAPAPGAPRPVTPPAVAERTLPNGLRVIVARTSDLPLVTAVFAVRSGSAAEPRGLGGLQDFTNDLLAQGTTRRDASAFAAAVEDLGGQLSTHAGFDESDLSLTVPVDQLGAALPLMGEAVRAPAFAAAEVERLRAQDLDALTVRLTQPGAVAQLAAAPLVFGRAPYGQVATPASLKRITREAVLAQYARAYRPDDAVLILTGDVEAEAGFALAARTFGDWRRPATPLSAPPASPPVAARGGRVVAIDLPGAGQAAVLVAAPALARDDPRYIRAEVAQSILGGGYSARLNEEVRVKRGLSYGASARLDARRGSGLGYAVAQTRNDAVAEVAPLMLGLVQGLGSAPAGPDELAARKATLIGERGLEQAESAGMARVLLQAAVYDRPLSEVGRYTQEVGAVDARGAEAAASAAMDPTRTVTVVVGDGKLFLPALKARYPDLQVVPAAALDLDSPTLTASR